MQPKAMNPQISDDVVNIGFALFAALSGAGFGFAFDLNLTSVAVSFTSALVVGLILKGVDWSMRLFVVPRYHRWKHRKNSK